MKLIKCWTSVHVESCRAGAGISAKCPQAPFCTLVGVDIVSTVDASNRDEFEAAVIIKCLETCAIDGSDAVELARVAIDDVFKEFGYPDSEVISPEKD